MTRKRPKTILATGISGCNRKDYLKGWEEYAQARGKKVKVFHVAKMMFEHARKIGFNLDSNNILNGDRDFLDLLRSTVFKDILVEISQGTAEYDAVVICNHYCFFWHQHYIVTFDTFVQELSPDLCITFIDNQDHIVERINQRPQWQNEGLTGGDILIWQGLEGEATSKFADMIGEPFFAVPTNASPSLLYRLAFHPEIEAIYSAMPISHFTDPEDRRQIDQFIERLDKYFVVFNPLAMEKVGAVKVSMQDGSEGEQKTVYDHIIYRDIDWLVRRSKKIIVFWPQRPLPDIVKASKELTKLWPRVIPSPGVNHEMHAAFCKTKDVWLVCHNKEASPFLTHFCTKFFPNTKSFFDFLKEQYPDRGEEKW